MYLYREVTSLFQTYMFRPGLAAAVRKMLANEPEFVTLGSVTDRAGRPGVGISIVDQKQPQFRFVLIGSLDTGQVLGFEDILVKDDPNVDAEAPSEFGFTAFVRSERVDETPTGP